MSKPKKRKLWGGRFENETASSMFNLSQSTHFDWRLASFDLLQTDVHAQALNKAGLISNTEVTKIRSAIKEINKNLFQLSPNQADEDVHTALERMIIEKVGLIGGKIRAGRSRNDQAVTDLKLFLRGSSRVLAGLILQLCETINTQALNNVDKPAPGFTHLQHAQPVSLGHELAKHSQALLRDLARFIDWDERTDSCGLGAGALAGSSLVPDPLWIAQQLGFSKVSENSIDAVSDRDFVAEYLFICAVIGIHLSKFAEEIILYTTSEFGYAVLSDEYSTGSSIMPQKKNPDAAELVRGKTGRLFGNLASIMTTLKALPFAYNRDLQEDKEPVFDSFDTLALVLPAFTGMVKTLKFDTDKLSEKSIIGHALATEIADFLVKKQIPFDQAHEISGQAVKFAEANGKEIHELSVKEFESISIHLDEDIVHVLDVEYALSSRSNSLGTSPKSIKKQISNMDDKIKIFSKWVKNNPVPELK
jgi:argininosuccinate lyase